MLFNFTVQPDRRKDIPAVTHVDNSSRIQTVNSTDNPLVYDVLREFDKRTGIPVRLNTSFNLRGHPIVHTPEQAFATFCSGGIDTLLIGSYLIYKEDVPDDIQAPFMFEKQFD
jgi:carbamoyltransferase